MVEVNSVFLHTRQLFIITGEPKSSQRYRTNSLLNVATFLFFRILLLGWMTRWLTVNRDRIPLSIFTIGSIGLAVIVTMNIILFCRILSVDFSDIFKKGEGKDKKEGKDSEDDVSDEEEGSGDKHETITAEDNSGVKTRAVYKRSAKHFLRDHLEGEVGGRVELTCGDYQQKTKILVVGFNTGAFLLLSLPDCSVVHSLAISDQQISSVRFNNSGDWVALGCPELGQLLEWEWQSEN